MILGRGKTMLGKCLMNQPWEGMLKVCYYIYHIRTLAKFVHPEVWA